MTSKMYENTSASEDDAVFALEQDIVERKERSEKTFQRLKIPVYSFFVVLGFAIYWLISSFLDRDPPLYIESITTSTPVVHQGSQFEFKIVANKVRANCTGVAKRQILDSESKLVIVSEYTLAAEMKISSNLIFDRMAIIPELVANGKAYFLYEIRYYCNWTHADWLMGPVLAKADPLPITIVSKPDPQPEK